MLLELSPCKLTPVGQKLGVGSCLMASNWRIIPEKIAEILTLVVDA